MKRPFHRSVQALVIALGLSVGVASAQNRAPENDAQVTTQRTANLSGPDQLREAQSVIDSVTSTRRRVSDMLDRARQERDILKVNCLNDKLTQIDVGLRTAGEHRELLQNAVSINNDSQRNHEFTLMLIVRSRSEALEGEARQCIGEDTGTFSDRQTTVRVTIDPNIPTQDTTALTSESLAPERPLVASPVM